MEVKFTPGPWKLREVGDKCKHLCPAAQDDTSILTVALEYHEDEEDPTYFGAVYNQADARLIAAAPELLEALKIAASYIGPNIPGVEMAKIEAAIAKAESRI